MGFPEGFCMVCGVLGDRRFRSVPVPCCSFQLTDSIAWAGLGLQCQSLCLAVWKQLPGCRNAEGRVGSCMGDPSGCGTGPGGSRPGRAVLFSVLGYLRVIPSPAPLAAGSLFSYCCGCFLWESKHLS